MLNKVRTWARDNQWLICILAVVIFLRIPSLFEPHWYGDEEIYLTVGQALNRGAVLYSQIHDNKPPLLYVMAAVAGGSLFWFKLMAAGAGVVAVIIIAKLAQKVFDSNPRAVFWTTLTFAIFTTVPLIEGNIANAELFFLPYTLLAVLLLWDKEVGRFRVFVAGLVLGLGGLFKIPAIIEFGVWPLVWLTQRDKRWMSNSVVLAVGVMLPILLSGVYFAKVGALQDYVVAAWAQNIPYLSSWGNGSGESGVFDMQGRIVVLAVWLAVTLGLSERWGRRGTVLATWLGFSLFSALLSGRQYPHYLLQTTGVAALATMSIVWGTKQERKIQVAGLILSLASIMCFKFYFYPVRAYYANFIRWSVGQIGTAQYFAWFNPMVLGDYKIARHIISGSSGSDKIFVWGDDPSLYALTQRPAAGKYVVKYHILDFKKQKDTLAELYAHTPKFVVIFDNEDQLPGLTEFLDRKYMLVLQAGKAKLYRFMKPIGIIK